MIDRQASVDLLMVGNGYLTTMLSLIYQSRHNQIMIVDDKRVGFGHEWSVNIGHLEKEFLRYWGSEYGVMPLVRIEDYLKITANELYIQDTILRLGATPYQNVIELLRKFGSVLDQELVKAFYDLNQEEFNRDFLYSLNRLAESSFKYKNFQNFDGSVFEEFLPANVLALFNSFYDHYLASIKENDGRSIIRHLTYVMQANFQSSMRNNLSFFEIAYLLTRLISPQFIIEEDRLNKDLMEIFTQQGGVFKSTTIQEWLVLKNSVEGILLDSFSGIVAPRLTYMMGGGQTDLPIHIEHNAKVYSCFHIKLQSQQPNLFFKSRIGQVLVYSSLKKVGTQFPLWKLQVQSDQSCLVKFLYPRQEGSKSSFYRDQVIKLLRQDLHLITDEDISELFHNVEFTTGLEEWVESFNYASDSRRKVLKPMSCKVVDRSGPKILPGIKDVKYWGPLKGRPLGLYSFMMELKNYAL